QKASAGHAPQGGETSGPGAGTASESKASGKKEDEVIDAEYVDMDDKK
ncbi:MAG: hypothetical protein H6Q06_2308, partial [Acidobacteria bacterium]|nr:hypothetical protein [Acidobacteriota bacterium]